MRIELYETLLKDVKFRSIYCQILKLFQMLDLAFEINETSYIELHRGPETCAVKVPSPSFRRGINKAPALETARASAVVHRFPCVTPLFTD